MMIIEVAVRGESPCHDRLVNAMAAGLKENMGATAWKLVASLTNNAGRNLGGIVRINEGRKPL